MQPNFKTLKDFCFLIFTAEHWLNEFTKPTQSLEKGVENVAILLINFFSLWMTKQD